MDIRYDLSWGEPIVVRQALLKQLSSLYFVNVKIDGLNYPDRIGELELRQLIKKFMLTCIGLSYNHVIITSGAQHALNILLGVLKSETQYIIHESPHFVSYPKIFEKNSFTVIKDLTPDQMVVDLINSPANPDGSWRFDAGRINSIKIWDGVYATGTYAKYMYRPKHDFFIGSIGKAFGVPGLRLGWIAFNKDSYFVKIKQAVHLDTIGTSIPSQKIALDIMSKTDIPLFMKESREFINDNKTELLKIKYLTPSEIPDNGMFFWLYADDSLRALLERSGVQYMDGAGFGDESHIRLNIAQDRQLISDMVKTVLLQDNKKIL